MKNGQKLKLGDAHVTPRIIQEVQASKLGDALSTNYQVLFQCAIFLLLHMICAVLGASLFLFQFSFVLFAVLYGRIPAKFVLEQAHSILIAKNTLVFTLIVLRVFYFSSTAFSSCFSFIFLYW